VYVCVCEGSRATGYTLYSLVRITMGAEERKSECVFVCVYVGASV
jgi:hypothetical protein